MSDESDVDRQLLRDFVETRSGVAFAELVRRHVDWIYVAACRQSPDSQTADDLTQAVFLVLAQKAPIAARQPVLPAWLFGVLRYASLRLQRDNARRRRHEALAAIRPHQQAPPASDEELLSMLDELVAQLREKDRRAIIVRFYEQRNLAEVGRSLGFSEEAARKRVDRAVEKLRLIFARRGICSSPEVLSAFLLRQGMVHAPKSAASAALKSVNMSATKTAIHLSKGALHMMKLQSAKVIVASVLAITVAAGGGLAGYAVCQAPHGSSASESTAQAPMRRVKFISSNQMLDNNLVVAISGDNLQISAYSDRVGRWTPMPTDAEAIRLLSRYGRNKYPPIITSTGVATIRLGKHVYAYSTETGTWDKLDVDDTPSADPSTSPGMVMINYDNHLAIFSAHTGKWSVVQWGK